MYAIYFDVYRNPAGAYKSAAAVSLPILERKRIKEEIRDAVKSLNKEDVTVSWEGMKCKSPMKTMYLMLNFLFEEKEMRGAVSSTYIPKATSKKFLPQMLCEMITALIGRKNYKKEIRVYLPATFTKYEYRQCMAGIKVHFPYAQVEKIPIEDSVFTQMANVMAGLHDYQETVYENHIGEKGRSQLVEYILQAPKTDKKYSTLFYAAKTKNMENPKLDKKYQKAAQELFKKK